MNCSRPSTSQANAPAGPSAGVGRFARQATVGRPGANKRVEHLNTSAPFTSQANALAERVIGTIRRECLDHLIVLNERHLRRVLREFVGYYNTARPHRSLALEPPTGPRDLPPPSVRSRVVAEPVLGGLHHVYDWAA